MKSNAKHYIWPDKTSILIEFSFLIKPYLVDLLLQNILVGVIIGILVSAPLGPIGVLVIQRTLSKGRIAGLFTGLGAAFSDLLYALASGLGLSVIIDFLHAHELTFQLIGSVVIAFFGYYLWRKNPLDDFNKGQINNASYGRYFATGFALTLSNPLIIFFFMALYARTNFITRFEKPSELIFGFASIALGALLWWIFITWVMSKARDHFNIRSLFLVNKVISIVMFAVSLFGFGFALYDLFIVATT